MKYTTTFEFAHASYRLIFMGKFFRHLVLWAVLLTATTSPARLEYDSQANKVQLYGPYIKYNILQEPYYMGRYQFSPEELTLEVSNSTAVNESDFGKEGDEAYRDPFLDSEPSDEGFDFSEVKSSSEPAKKKAKQPTPTEEEREPQSDGENKIYAVWPRFFMNFGQLKLYSKSGRVLLETTFSPDELGPDERFARFELKGEGEDLLKALQEPFRMCIRQEFEKSLVKACSNILTYKDGKFLMAYKGKNLSAAKLNGKKAPKNAQISLAKNMPKVQLELKFKSGFSFQVKDKVHHMELKNIAIDPREKRIGIVDGEGAVRPTRLTIKDRFFSFIKENNYYRNQYATERDWPSDLEDAEMEFSPYQTGASTQLYGLILPNVPPPFKFKMDDDIPIATYSRKVELTGTKEKSEVLAARIRNELFIHENQEQFLWQFPADQPGTINQNYLSLQHKGKDYYFSKRIFRAHQSAVSGALALSTSPTLDIVPGYNFSAEHWFEELVGKQSWSLQRWGVAANVYETIEGFKPKENFPEKISVLPMNFDLLYRFSPGVRPVQSSFGLGVRYLNFKLFRSISTDIQAQFLGIGGFWHTAPQKIIDDIFNIVPFFRYPKWMEISLFYYPLLIGNEQLGFSFSWQTRGKLFFAKQWYLDVSFNVNNISFRKAKIAGVTAGADSFGIATAHGTIGVGYLFN